MRLQSIAVLGCFGLGLASVSLGCGKSEYRCATPDAKPKIRTSYTPHGKKLWMFDDPRPCLRLDGKTPTHLEDIQLALKFAGLPPVDRIVRDDGDLRCERQQREEGRERLGCQRPSVGYVWPDYSMGKLSISRRLCGRSFELQRYCIGKIYLDEKDESTP